MLSSFLHSLGLKKNTSLCDIETAVILPPFLPFLSILSFFFYIRHSTKFNKPNLLQLLHYLPCLWPQHSPLTTRKPLVFISPRITLTHNHKYCWSSRKSRLYGLCNTFAEEIRNKYMAAPQSPIRTKYVGFIKKLLQVAHKSTGVVELILCQRKLHKTWTTTAISTALFSHIWSQFKISWSKAGVKHGKPYGPLWNPPQPGKPRRWNVENFNYVLIAVLLRQRRHGN